MDQRTVYVDLQNLGTSIAAADTYLKFDRFENAVQGYQAAASQGLNIAAAIGTDADAVHQAIASANAVLALDWNLASQQTAVQASTIARQMQTQLQQAFGTAPVVVAPVVAPIATPVVPASKPIDPMWIALGGLALAAAGGFAWWYFLKRPHENPASGSSSKARGKTLIAKGSRTTRFEMVDGPDVTVTGAMLHDPSGRWWPKNSVLFGRFKNGRKAADEEFVGPAKDYLGHSHNARMSEIDTPPKGLADWKYVGDVETIFYTRTGRKRPGYYRHTFNKGTALATWVKGRGRVRLYRRGRHVRLELPRGAMLDSRGFLWP